MHRKVADVSQIARGNGSSTVRQTASARAFDPREAAVPVGRAGNVYRRTPTAAAGHVGSRSAQRAAPTAAADQADPGQQSFNWSQGVPNQHLPLTLVEEHKLDKVDKELNGYLRLLRTQRRVVYFKQRSGHYRSYEVVGDKSVPLLNCAEPHRLYEALAGRKTVPGERGHHSDEQRMELIFERQEKEFKRAQADSIKCVNGVLQRAGSCGEAANALRKAAALEQELAAARRDTAAVAAAAQQHADLAKQELARRMKLEVQLAWMCEKMLHLRRRAEHAEHAAETAIAGCSHAESQLEGLQAQNARLQGHLKDVQKRNGLLQDQLDHMGTAWRWGSQPAAKRQRPNHSHQRH